MITQEVKYLCQLNTNIFHTLSDYFMDIQLGMGPIVAVPVQYSVVAACCGPVLSTVHRQVM